MTPEPPTDVPPVRDSYRTAPGQSTWLRRRLPSLFFYARLFPTVYGASRKARCGAFDKAEWIARARHCAWRALERVGAAFHVENAGVFARLDSPCVIVANHMSTLETFALCLLVPPERTVTFVVKESLLRYPVFGPIMRARDPVAVSRENPREDLKAVLAGGAERLAKGIDVVVFPQTTRTPRFDRAHFNSIGVKLARRAGVPVVPLALKTDAWGTGWPVKDFGRIHPERTVHFCFGEPIAVTGTGKDAHETVMAFIEGKLRDWLGLRDEAPAGPRP